MIRHCRLLVSLILLQACLVFAHEVHHAVNRTDAVAIRLTYADGKPFTFEAFEAYPDGKDMPAHVGRTDAEGRAVFVPGDVKRWRVKAFSADGHGIDVRIDTPPATTTTITGAQNPDSAGPNRASVLVFGFSFLLALFGSYQLWFRKKS